MNCNSTDDNTFYICVVIVRTFEKILRRDFDQ